MGRRPRRHPPAMAAAPSGLLGHGRQRRPPATAIAPSTPVMTTAAATGKWLADGRVRANGPVRGVGVGALVVAVRAVKLPSRLPGSARTQTVSARGSSVLSIEQFADGAGAADVTPGPSRLIETAAPRSSPAAKARTLPERRCWDVTGLTPRTAACLPHSCRARGARSDTPARRGPQITTPE